LNAYHVAKSVLHFVCERRKQSASSICCDKKKRSYWIKVRLGRSEVTMGGEKSEWRGKSDSEEKVILEN
jgi:hypothetical protein